MKTFVWECVRYVLIIRFLLHKRLVDDKAHDISIFGKNKDFKCVFAVEERGTEEFPYCFRIVHVYYENTL